MVKYLVASYGGTEAGGGNCDLGAALGPLDGNLTPYNEYDSSINSVSLKNE